MLLQGSEGPRKPEDLLKLCWVGAGGIVSPLCLPEVGLQQIEVVSIATKACQNIRARIAYGSSFASLVQSMPSDVGGHRRRCGRGHEAPVNRRGCRAQCLLLSREEQRLGEVGRMYWWNIRISRLLSSTLCVCFACQQTKLAWTGQGLGRSRPGFYHLLHDSILHDTLGHSGADLQEPQASDPQACGLAPRLN